MRTTPSIPAGVCLEHIVISLTADAVWNIEEYSYELKLKASNQTRVVPLHSGNCTTQQTVVWEMKFNGTCDTCLGFDLCITVDSVSLIQIQALCDVNTVVQSVFSIVCAEGECQLATLDFHVYRQLNGDGTHDQRVFPLTLLIGC